GPVSNIRWAAGAMACERVQSAGLGQEILILNAPVLGLSVGEGYAHDNYLALWRVAVSPSHLSNRCGSVAGLQTLEQAFSSRQKVAVAQFDLWATRKIENPIDGHIPYFLYFAISCLYCSVLRSGSRSGSSSMNSIPLKPFSNAACRYFSARS